MLHEMNRIDENLRLDELTHAELEAQTAELLPERAAMSTLSVTGLDAATGTVEAVADGVSASATGDSVAGDATAATPEPAAAAEPVAADEAGFSPPPGGGAPP